ncbi:MAG: Rieske 2Fe-2S domain-containing protein, partial [Ktedonobacteraceae bacterium]
MSSTDSVLKAESGRGGGARVLDRSSAPHGVEPVTSAIWPRKDYSRVPYRLYHDPSVYQLELQRVFDGVTWSFIGFDVEVPNAGDFRASYIGTTPIIFNRDDDGEIKAFVNRCTHRGALVARDLTGNTKTHTCIYHQWCFQRDGKLIGVPFRRGVKGQGGFSKDFNMADHGLRKVRIANVYGVLFGTLSSEAEPIEDYLEPKIRDFLKRIFEKPIRILGYHRQRVRGNWKAYTVNPRDNYHASLLHDFFGTFGLDRTSQVGGLTMDARHRHCITWGRAEDEAAHQNSRQTYASEQVQSSNLTLREPSLAEFRQERADDLSVAIVSIFPNCIVQQIANSVAARQVRPRGPDEFEIFQTVIGYQDDTPEMTMHRLRQTNLIGPAGLVSMEDGEAIEIAHRASKPEREGAAEVVELGGGGPISDRNYRANDVSVRGFWSYYAELLGIE